MILQRDPTTRKVQQQQYRKQLYNSIQQKQALLKNKSRVVEHVPPSETFSLIKNIEDEEERRKNRKKEYYQELEKQRQEEIEYKRRKMEEEKRNQLETDAKIQRQKEVLRLRYEEQRKREGRKQNAANQRAKQLQQHLQQQQLQKQQQKMQKRNQSRVKPVETSNFPHDSIDTLENMEKSQHEQNRIMGVSELPVTFAYPNRVENQEFNFPQRRVLSTNYYRELQLEKRNFQQQTQQMYELNRYLGSQRNGLSKRNTQGLQSLRQLQKMLTDQTNSMKQQFGPAQRWNTYQNRSTYDEI